MEKEKYQIRTLHITVPLALMEKIKEKRLLPKINEITINMWIDYLEALEYGQ